MDAEAFGVVAVVGYVFAAIFAVIAVILFFTLRIRSVRDDLTGRTAERAIADLREGRGSRSRFFGGEERGSAARSGAKSRVSVKGDSGSLKLRRHSSGEEPSDATGATGAVVEDFALTTAIGGEAAPGAEGSTTLLGDEAAGGASADSPRTVPAGDAPACTPRAAAPDEDASATTMLGGADTAATDEGASATTLLGPSAADDDPAAAQGADGESSTTLLSDGHDKKTRAGAKGMRTARSTKKGARR